MHCCATQLTLPYDAADIILCFALLLPAMWFIPPANAAPTRSVSTNSRGNSGINGDQLRMKMHLLLRERGEPLYLQIRTYFQGELQGCALPYGHFPATLISCFSLSALSLCLYAFFTKGETREAGVPGGKRACVGVFMVQRSLVCIWWMRESGSREFMAVDAAIHSALRVPACPQGHRAPPGPISGGSLGILLRRRHRLAAATLLGVPLRACQATVN